MGTYLIPPKMHMPRNLLQFDVDLEYISGDGSKVLGSAWPPAKKMVGQIE
jgi:hypothetical protein